MCSLIGSFDKEELKKLVAANEYRGNRTSSITTFDFNYNLVRSVNRIDGPMVESTIDFNFDNGLYHIIHMQAPTGENSGIHPAKSPHNGLLWHNGIILNCENEWDTQQMVNDLDKGYKSLSKYDGSFACIHLAYEMRIFRNEISPLFVSENGSISSAKVEGFNSLPPNKVFSAEGTAGKVSFFLFENFSTLNNPYDF